MTLPLVVWGTLLGGALLLGMPDRPVFRRLARWSLWGVWGAFVAALWWDAPALPTAARAAWGLSLLWSLGFCPQDPAPQQSGRHCLTLGALSALALSPDWLFLGLSWELVRRATSRASVGSAELSIWLSSVFWLAAAAWFFCTGSWELQEIAMVLQQASASPPGMSSARRLSPLLHAAVALTCCAVLIPCLAQAARRSNEPDAVGHLLGRQLAALLLMERCCRELHFGLESPWSVLLLVSAGVWGACAMWFSVFPSHLERFWTGCSFWQMFAALTWLLVMVAEHTPGVANRVEAHAGAWFWRELAHMLLVLSGATSAVRLMQRSSGEVHTLEELRGAGREHPAWSVLLFVPLASLLGCPLLWGGWLRWLGLVEQWSLLREGSQDTLQPQPGLMVLQGWAAVVGLVMVGSVVACCRTVLWEHSFHRPVWRGSWWSSLLAVGVTVWLIAGGLMPALWLQ